MITDIDRTFAALAEPTRRRIVELLREHPRRAGEIADTLGMSGPATSRHLRVLRRGGIIAEIEVEDDARVRVYGLRPESFTVLHQWIDHVEAFWSDQLEAFRDHAERTREAGPSGGSPDSRDIPQQEEGAAT